MINVYQCIVRFDKTSGEENESEVLDAVSSQPRVAALKGNPRRCNQSTTDGERRETSGIWGFD